MDPRSLKPGDLARLLNSTPLGPVITERRLGQQRLKAGMHVAADGDQRRVDLFRWVAWLAGTRDRGSAVPTHVTQTLAPPILTGYEAHKERARHRSSELSRSGRDIGELPPVADPDRKERCRLDLKLFLETYFPRLFYNKWSDDHLVVIARIERVVLTGGTYAIAMPRGSGKSTLCECACIWATFYGHASFIVLVGANQTAAEQNLDSIKENLRENEFLASDFPEVCYPIEKLEGINQRASGQLYQGVQTRMAWTQDQVILPTIAGSRASSAIIRVAGITGRIRGLKFTRPDGRAVRPDLVLVDDPQTEESSCSPAQCAKRIKIIHSAILGLAGPTTRISCLATVTVMYPDDVADQLLDRKKYPQWQGERTKLMYAMPTNDDLWKKYEDLYNIGRENNRDFTLANAFYTKNRVKMDAGAKPAWPERFYPGELSAIQHAMNIRIERGIDAFEAEFQNEPRRVDTGPKLSLDAATIAARTNGYKRGEVPDNVSAITAFADVQKTCLYWLVVGWEPDYTGHVIDYGIWPDQGRRGTSLRDVKKTLMLAYPGGTLQSAFYSGVSDLTLLLCGREFKKPNGVSMRLDRLLFDANYDQSQAPIYEFCRQTPYAAMVMPSRGRAVTAAQSPMNDLRRTAGERTGNNWRMPKAAGYPIRHLTFDTNYWKSHVARALTVPKGAAGGVWLFGDKSNDHRGLAEQLEAEYPVRTSGRGREVDQWFQRPDRPDNHWFDCLVGCAVAANVAGVKAYAAESPKRKKIKLSQLFAR